HPLLSGQLRHPVQEGTRIGPLRRPLHTLENPGALTHLAHQLLLLQLDGVGQATTLRARLGNFRGERAPLRDLEQQDDHEEDGHQRPCDCDGSGLHWERSVNRMLMFSICPLPSLLLAPGLISQLLSWKRLLTAGSRMIPAMNWATSTSGGLPGRR